MLAIALATLRARRGGFVGAFVALFCAAALVSACGMLLDTGLRGQVSPQRYAAAPLLVAADQELHFVESGHDKTKTKSKPATETVHLPGDETARVRAVAGVAAAVPEVTFPATVVGSDGERVSGGHGWGSAPLAPFTLARGRAPTASDEVVLDAAAPARLGERVSIRTQAATSRYTVVGVTAQALSGQPVVFFADATAARFAGDRLTAVGVWPAPGTDPGALAAALERTGATVSTGAARGAVEFAGATRAQQSLVSMSAVLGGTALLVAVLVIVGTLALSIEQRHAEIALLRAVGATPRQIPPDADPRGRRGRDCSPPGSAASPACRSPGGCTAGSSPSAPSPTGWTWSPARRRSWRPSSPRSPPRCSPPGSPLGARPGGTPPPR